MFVKENKTGIVFKAKQLSTNGIHNGCAYQSGDYLLIEVDNAQASSVTSGDAFRNKFSQCTEADLAPDWTIEAPAVEEGEVTEGLVVADDPKPVVPDDTNAIDAGTTPPQPSASPASVDDVSPEQPKRGRRK